MFQQVSVEILIMEHKYTNHGDDGIRSYMKPVQFKLPLFDRVLLTLGDLMIRIGIKLKQRSHAPMISEQAHSPTFMIML